MSDTKHTPGPWTLSDETERDGLKSKLLYGKPEGMLAIIRVEHQGRYYGDANAHLIAAAPDLYKALVWAMGKINPPNSVCTDEAHERFNFAMAAIAKAEGGAA